VRLRGNVWVGEGVQLADLELVEGPAFVGNYCRIAPRASVGPYSVLSNSVTLRDHARTSRSIVDASTYVGRSALVEGAIVGKSCDIRPHARLHEGVAVGDSCTIGEQSVVMPGIRIYPFKEVESGALVDRHLIWESRMPSRLFGRESVTGLINVDLTPETVLRVGIALGTALKRGDRTVVSRAAPPACRLLKRAVLSGIISTGVHVADLHVMPPAVTRHFLKNEGIGAGVHVRPSAQDPEVLEIQLFEPPGMQATPEFVKEVEKHFLRQEFRRAAYDEVGKISSPARAAEGYVADLIRTVDVDAIRARAFRIVVEYSHSAVSLVLPLVLGALGVEAIGSHPYAGEYASATALREAVEPRLETLERRLRECSGCVEIGVRAALPARERSTSADGTAYMRARAEEEGLLDDLDRRLKALARESIAARAGEVGYLVPRTDVDAFAADVERYASAHPELAIVCTGPWAPYSFASAA
jgi:mannose-1-phosphate guanylyltransferase/phosphomannomutase